MATPPGMAPPLSAQASDQASGQRRGFVSQILVGLLLLMVCMPAISQTAMDASAMILGLFCLGVFLQDFGRHPRAAVASFPRFGWDWVVLVWLFCVFLSFVFSPLLGSMDFMRWFPRILEARWLVFAYFLSYVGREMKLTARGLGVCLGLLLFACAWAIMIFITNYDPLHPNATLSNLASGLPRTPGLIGHAITFGHVYAFYFCFLTGIALYMLKFPEDKIFKKFRFLFWMTYVLLFTALIMNFTRGAWMEMIVALIAGGFIMNKKMGAFLTTFVAAIGGTLVAFSPGIRSRIGDTITGDTERIWIWRANWAIFRDHPWLGVGYGDNKLLMTDYFKRIGAPENTLVSHAHNQYLNMLSGTGAISTFFYLLMWALLAITLWKTFVHFRSQPHYGALLLGSFLCILGFFVGGLTEANYEHSKIKILLSCVWAITLYFYYKKSHPKRDDHGVA